MMTWNEIITLYLSNFYDFLMINWISPVAFIYPIFLFVEYLVYWRKVLRKEKILWIDRFIHWLGLIAVTIGVIFSQLSVVLNHDEIVRDILINKNSIQKFK